MTGTRALGAWGLAAALLAAAACHSGPTTPDDFPITGTWTASSFRYVSAADPARSVDLVAQGSTVTLIIDESAFNLSIQTSGQSPVVWVGTWTQSQNGLELLPVGAAAPWTFLAFQGQDTLSLSGARVTHDFGAGPEEAILSLDLYLQR